ncbi:MAG TPA: cytochrome P450 [Solirubrobacteraceae bacterium]|nr:cytochrome P450 [Solirubrobacteraceae bacterium]
MNSILENRRIKRQLPPGPKVPPSLQMAGSWLRPTAVSMRARERYGKRFSVRLLGQPHFVVLSDPEDIKQVFQAPPEVLHPGEGARILEPIVGPNSVILLDEKPHLSQRKLMLPAFHGDAMQSLAELMSELTEREIASWPQDQPVALHPRLQQLTLEIVLRAVFGLEQGAQLDRLRELLTQVLEFAENPISLLPFAQRALAGRGPMGRLERLGEETDRLIFELIEQRRSEDAQGPDVLTLLLGAEHEDGSPMSPAELRDELVTALVAGHETTASQLAWGFELLARNPRVATRLAGELDEDPDSAYLTATIQEIMRMRPVLMNAEPRLVKQQVEIGGVSYPPGVVLIASAYLVHHDPDIYPQPYAFRPERFLESEGGKAPGTYTWLPFGGGRRRCLGASFALLEMKIVLRAVLERNLVMPVGDRPERARRRSIPISPARGCEVILRAQPQSSLASESALGEKVPALAPA